MGSLLFQILKLIFYRTLIRLWEGWSEGQHLELFVAFEQVSVWSDTEAEEGTGVDSGIVDVPKHKVQGAGRAQGGHVDDKVTGETESKKLKETYVVLRLGCTKQSAGAILWYELVVPVDEM